MAIQTTNMADVQRAQQTQQEQDQAYTKPAQSSFSLSSRMFGAPISKSVGSEDYVKIKEGLAEIFQRQENKEFKIALIDLDRVNEPALMYSALIVAMQYIGKPSVAYHILIIEATGEPLLPLIINSDNRNIEVMRVTSDALDIKLYEKAEEKVHRAFPNNQVHMVGGCVIPRSFNPLDKNALDGLALNASWSIGTELQVKDPDGFIDLNLATEQNNTSLNVNVTFAKQQLHNVVGLPMRSDVLINFDARAHQNKDRNQQEIVNTGDRESKISEISGFIDLQWSPVNQMAPVNPYIQQQEVIQGFPGQQPVIPTQKFAAQLVITNLASNFSMTTGSKLLAISTSFVLNSNDTYYHAFKPTMAGGKNEIDMCDIGALNYEGNLANDPSGIGEALPTKSENFKLEHVGNMLKLLLRPGLSIAVDCPEVSAQSWYLDEFSTAASGGRQSEAAYKHIYDAADRLTNGAFKKYFSFGTPMFDNLGNRIHMGYWTDKSGMKRDIRDFDYLAVCNLCGKNNPTYITDWTDTFYRTDYSLDLRMASRKKIIDHLSNHSAVYTGFYNRVTFSQMFLQALAAGIQETKFVVHYNTPLTGNEFANRRGVASFVNNTLLNPNVNYMIPGGYGNQAGPGQYYAPNQFRTF